MYTETEYTIMPDIFHFDDYDECFYDSTDPKYCMSTIELLPKHLIESSSVWKIIENASSNEKNYRHDLLRHGVCTSNKCLKYNVTDIECLNRLYTMKYSHLGLESQINKIHCEKKSSHQAIDSTDLAVVTILGLYVIFVVLVSIWVKVRKDEIQNNSKRNRGDKKSSITNELISAFSLSDNLQYIINLNTRKETKNYIGFLQGIRFFISTVIITIHSVGINFVIAVSDTKVVEKLASSFLSICLTHTASLVQTFFVISFWLMTLNFYDSVKRKQYINFGYVVRRIIKRYIRFTSGQVLLIVLHSTLFIHLFRGPFWEQIMGFEYKQCSEKWWINLLYINNFFFDQGVCLPHTWYLSVDFQLTILGLLILWLTQKNPKHLLLTLGVLIALQIIFTFFYLKWNNFEFGIIITPELAYDFKLLFSKEWQATWVTTFSNLAGLASGIFFSYLYIKLNDKQYIIKKRHQVLWWILTISLTFGTILFSAYYGTTSYYSKNIWFSATYGSIDKVLRFFGIGFFIFGMSLGLGGVVKKVLELPVMHTLGQLSFGAYLVHVTFLKIDIASQRTFDISYYLMLTTALRHLSMSYLTSIIITTFVLMPVDNICKKLF